MRGKGGAKGRGVKIGPGTDAEAEMGPLVTKPHLEKVLGYIEAGVKEGAKLVVDGRGFKMQGYENGYFIGGTLFDRVSTGMKIYKERTLWACPSNCSGFPLLNGGQQC